MATQSFGQIIKFAYIEMKKVHNSGSNATSRKPLI